MYLEFNTNDYGSLGYYADCEANCDGNEIDALYLAKMSNLIPAGFKQQLVAVIANQILQVLNEYQADVIEVIGHTDLQPMNQAIRTTNLDAESQKFFISDRDMDLRAKNNAGLGYARALSVTKQLKKIPQLSGYTILPYSAAQMISPDETINLDPHAFESSQLRRIEI